LWARDGNAAGRGSKQKYHWKKKGTKHKALRRFVQAALFSPPRFYPFSDRLLPVFPSSVRRFSPLQAVRFRVFALSASAFSHDRDSVFNRPAQRFSLTVLSFCSDKIGVQDRPYYVIVARPQFCGAGW